MSPYWMLNIFICAIHISQALVLKAPQSPALLGDTLKITWRSESGDPPCTLLNATKPLISTSLPPVPAPESNPVSSIPGLNLIPSQTGAPPEETVITASLISTKYVGSESNPTSSIPGLNLIPSRTGGPPGETVVTASVTSAKDVGTTKATLSLPTSIFGTFPTTIQAMLPSSDTLTPSSTTTQASSELNGSRNNGGPIGVGVIRMTPLVTISAVLLLLLNI
ncbi:hypothetical protein FPV67DRAFT_1529253 [Lyophyllum atratum]|nr:hypothetical protein FPV67DRAFT_1529253 [Lyophyllum atratum]